MDSTAPQPVTLKLKADRRTNDQARALWQARHDLLVALRLLHRRKVKLEKLLREVQ